MRYATVVVKVHAGKTTKWAHALMIGKESLKGWWILTTFKKWKNFEKNFFEKWSEIVSTHRVYLFHLLWIFDCKKNDDERKMKTNSSLPFSTPDVALNATR